MANLVGYSDSDGSEVDASLSRHVVRKKRRRSHEQEDDLPALPEAFHDLYATGVRLSNQDDPALHGGRQRTNRHIEGNWPSHVYVEWLPDEKTSDNLKSVIQRLKPDTIETGPHDQAISFLDSELGSPAPLHISLSSSLNLQAEQKDSFIDQLADAIRNSKVRPFNVGVKRVCWVPNRELNRWFLVLQLRRTTEDEFSRLLQACNAIAASFNQPELYSENMDSRQSKRTGTRPSSDSQATGEPLNWCTDVGNRFHISIAWMLAEPGNEIRDRAETFPTEDLKAISVAVSSVKIRTGNIITSMPLARRSRSSKTMLGD